MNRLFSVIMALSFLLISLTATALAQEKAPIQVGVAPVISINSNLEQSECDIVRNKLTATLRIPLNNLRHVTEDIPADQVGSTFKAVTADLKAINKKVKAQEIVKETAHRLNADVLVVPEVYNAYYEYVGTNRSTLDTLFQIGDDLEIYIYDKKTDTVKSYSRIKHDVVAFSDNASLAKLLASQTDSIIDESRLFYYVHPEKAAKSVPAIVY